MLCPKPFVSMKITTSIQKKEKQARKEAKQTKKIEKNVDEKKVDGEEETTSMVKKEEEEFRANKQKEITKTKTETKNHNYNNNYNKDRTPKVVTRYHNSFNEHFRKYSEDELEAKLLRVQNSKKAK